MTVPGEGGHGVGRRAAWPPEWLAITSSIFLFLFRFVMGRPILKFADYRPTNATFWHKGTKAHSEWDRLTFWAYLPEGVRALVRLCAVGVVFSFFWAWLFGTVWAEAVTLVGTLGPALVGINFIGDRIMHHGIRHRNRFVVPLHQAINKVLSDHIEHNARIPIKNVLVPLDFRMRNSGGVVIKLEPNRYYSSAVQQAIASCVAQKLSFPNPRVSFDSSKRVPRMVFKVAIQPPKLVRFAELIPVIEACGRGEVVLGKDEHEQIFKHSLKKGDPHCGFSVNTQLGKSTHAQNFVAQILHQDLRNAATYIDPKQVSCIPLRGTPGLTLVDDPADIEGMWDAITDVRNILNARRAELATDPTAEWGIHLLVIDELNMFAEMTKRHWMDIKTSNDPHTAPIWGTLAEVIWQGARFDIHVVFYGQLLNERACGGIGLRSQLGLVGMAGFSPNWWKTLVGTTPPPKPKGQGRWVYAVAGEPVLVQNVFASEGHTKEDMQECWEREIRDWAQAGRKEVTNVSEAVDRHDPVSDHALHVVDIPDLRDDSGISGRLLTIAQISMDEGEGLVPMKAAAIRQAKKRAKDRGDEWPRAMTEDEWRKKLRRFEVVGSSS